MAAGERLGIGIVRLLWASDSDTHSSGKLQGKREITNTLPVKCTHDREMCVWLCVLTCPQDTSAPELSSDHLVPHVAPSPVAQNTPTMSETTKRVAEWPVVRPTHLCDFWGF
jgi:hypothetical protein